MDLELRVGGFRLPSRTMPGKCSWTWVLGSSGFAVRHGRVLGSSPRLLANRCLNLPSVADDEFDVFLDV